MISHHYPLQVVLYQAALHAHLRRRLVGYDPQRHLGPAHWIFLRGAGRGPGDGVVTIDPDPALLDTVLATLGGVHDAL